MSSPSRRLRLGMHIDETDPVRSARDLEAQGFDYVSCGEHLVFHGPTTSSFVTLAAAAAVTRSIRLVSAVVVASLYPPLMLAKIATTLDILSSGRYDLGVGVGGDHPREFETAGIPLAQRGRRTDEVLEVLRRCWTESAVTFDGRFHRFRHVPFEPKPIQKPHPPIWIGGRSRGAMRRAGRYGDVWLPYLYTPEMLESSVEVVRDAAREAGRDPDGIAVGASVTVVPHDDAAVARRTAIAALSRIYGQDFTGAVDKYVVYGPPADVRRRLIEFREAGARTVLMFIPPSAETADATRVIATEVMPELR